MVRLHVMPTCPTCALKRVLNSPGALSTVLALRLQRVSGGLDTKHVVMSTSPFVDGYVSAADDESFGSASDSDMDLDVDEDMGLQQSPCSPSRRPAQHHQPHHHHVRRFPDLSAPAPGAASPMRAHHVRRFPNLSGLQAPSDTSPATSLFADMPSQAPPLTSPSDNPSNLLAAAAAGLADGMFSSPECHSPMSFSDTTPPSFHISAVSTPSSGKPTTKNPARSGGSTPSTGRPVPDQDAFEFLESMTRTPPKTSPACPPTPARTPAWAAPVLVRDNSLNANRTLLESDDEDEGSPDGNTRMERKVGPAPNFERDFDNLGEIGQGSFSRVYKVRWRHDGNMYAVKRTLRPYRSKRDREQYLNEMRMVKTIEANPNIIHYKLAWQEQGFLFMQIELCSRGSLQDLLDLLPQGSAVPAEAVYTAIADCASGLVSIHKADMVHLDVKPDNLFIAATGMLKVGDFGTARKLTPGWYSTPKDDDGAEGDNRYMALELLSSGGITPAADIFSLGMTAFQMAWGVALPTEGPDWQNLRKGVFPPLPAYARAAGRPVALINLIQAMLHPDPRRRPTAEQIFAIPAVRAAHGSAHKVLVQSSTTAVTDPTKRRLMFAPLAEGRSLGRSSSYTTAVELEIPNDLGETTSTPAASEATTATAGSATGGGSGDARPSLRRSGTIAPAGIALTRMRSGSGGVGQPMRPRRLNSFGPAPQDPRRTAMSNLRIARSDSAQSGVLPPSITVQSPSLTASDTLVTPTNQPIHADWWR